MWHPNDEKTATSNRTALVEWLRATGRWENAEPAELDRWLAALPAGQDLQLDALRGLASPAT